MDKQQEINDPKHGKNLNNNKKAASGLAEKDAQVETEAFKAKRLPTDEAPATTPPARKV